ncbi:MAG: glycosyltransferase [Candidatus Competibacterales bacterium]
MPRRLLWYAPGGGLGHVTRAVAILRHLRPHLHEVEPLLVVTSPHLHGPLLQGIPTLRLPSRFEWQAFGDGAGDLARAFQGLFAALGPWALLVVDSFADGLAGELTPDLLAQVPRRALIYRLGATDPRQSPGWSLYQSILAPYPSHPCPGAEAVGYVLLRSPREVLSPPRARRQLGVDDQRPLILALHAGDPGEVASLFTLVSRAFDALGERGHLRLLTPLPTTEGHRPQQLYYYPAVEVLPGADLVVAAAGYNSVAEVGALGKRALLCPFTRSHDDQRLRATGAEVFDLTEDPHVLAERMAAALAKPSPPALALGACDGAKQAAQRLRTLLTEDP